MALRKERPGEHSRVPLGWRIFMANAMILLVAWAFFAFTPASVKPPFVIGGLVELVMLGLVLLANFVLVRRALAPLNRLTAVARRFDPLRPGPRIPVYGDDAEVVELTKAFNEMLDRLERERRESARRALAAQEGERRRVARELHDEIGQSLTGVLLQIEHIHRIAPPEIAKALEPARETARTSLEEVKRIARRLRPEALDDLGLRSALLHLTERVATQGNIRVTRALDHELPPLDADRELVVYRIAQEALTNAVRHSGAARVDVRLQARDGDVILSVADDGRGMQGPEGGGITGMRERAVLAGADLEIGESREGGVRVILRMGMDGA
jgi:two-component system sensor histidine kinase UhpB